MNEERISPARIFYQDAFYIADMEQLLFRCIYDKAVRMPFYLFSEEQWLCLEWDLYMPDYKKVIELMHTRLESFHRITDELMTMFSCVRNYHERHEQYEILGVLQKKRPLLFATPSCLSHDNGDTLSGPDETGDVVIKACPLNQNYVYDVSQKLLTVEKVFNTSHYVFFRVHLGSKTVQQTVYDRRIKKRGFVYGSIFKRDPEYFTHYYQVVSLVSGEIIGYIHVYAGPGGIKEIHYNSRIPQFSLMEATQQFIAGYGLFHYKHDRAE